MIIKKAVLFDVDGVLLDTWDFIFGAFEYTLTTHGHPIPADELIQKAMGKPLLEFYKTIFPNIDPNIFGKTHHQYQQGKFDLGKPFPNAKKTLKRLKKAGFSIAAISNRARNSLLISLDRVKLLEFFDLVVSAEDVKNPKPHPDHVYQALKKLKVKPNQAYMVGDTDVDILAGKSAGIKTIAVTYGFAGKEILKHHPDFVIDDIEDLIKIIQNPSSFPKKQDLKSNPK